MLKRLTILALTAVLTLAFAASGLAGVSVENQFFKGQLNLASDDSGDFLFNRTAGATTVDLGDILIAPFAIRSVEDLSGGGGTNSFGSGGVNEFSGLAAIEVTSKSGGPGAFTWTFGPVSAAGRAALTGNGTMPLLAGEIASWGATTMAAFFDDATPDFIRTGGPDDGAPGDTGVGPFAKEDSVGATAIDGKKILEIGANAGHNGGLFGDTFWLATATTDDITVIGALAAPLTGGDLNFALDLFFNDTKWKYRPLASTGTQFAGSGDLFGTRGATTPFDSFDKFDIVFNPIPEASTLVIWGGLMSLVGLVGFIRRRRSA